MSEWQPIATAPKNGKHVLLSFVGAEEKEACVCWFDKRKKEWRWSHSEDGEYGQPTHWMALPPPPPKEEK